MNGLYIHVPFCQKRCIYCDFFSTTCGETEKQQYVEALKHEMALRANYLPDHTLSTIYLGGGTPSQLSPTQLDKILNVVFNLFSVDSNAEITIEVNPDDVTDNLASALRTLPVNRVSMGIQSFDGHLLRLLNRRHTAAEAEEAVDRLLRNGIDNISVDLMYGLPQQTLSDFQHDVHKALHLPIRHLSAYALMYEEGTRLWQMREKGQLTEVDDDTELEMFRLLMDITEAAGMEHYEISNFAYPGWHARHNSGYWNEMNYLGCGPAAHSYNGSSRQWNTADLQKYLDAQGDVIAAGLVEKELLTPEMKFNETVMKSLRTSDGLDLTLLTLKYGKKHTDRLLSAAQNYLEEKLLVLDTQQQKLRLTRDGIFVSDGIMSDLMETAGE